MVLLVFVSSSSPVGVSPARVAAGRLGSRPATSDPEISISNYVKNYVDSGKSLCSYIVHHFGSSLSTLVALRRLPGQHIVLSAEAEGAAIRTLLSPHSAFWRMTGLITAVLSLPREPGQYSLGASRRTLRSKVRRAGRLGLCWAEVNDPEERRHLLQLANECERTHPDVAYRTADPDNHDLLGYRLWLAAFSADGRPLLLCVAPVDGELALLRYFRTLGSGEEQSNARYFMAEVLVERLVRLGVRYLFDGISPFWLPNGLRHFQRMLGFRIVRVHIARSGPFRPRRV